MRPGTDEGVVYPFCNCCSCHAVVLCREAKMQVRSGWGNYRQYIYVGSVWVKSVNVNKKFFNFLQQQVYHQQVQQNLLYEPAYKTMNHCSENKIKAVFAPACRMP